MRIRKWRMDPKRSTYIPQADLMVKDRDQIAGEIFMRMTPRQLETRCTRNKVHMVFDELPRQNPCWCQPSMLSLLGKGPKFIPKASRVSSRELLNACARLNYRLVRAFERFFRKETTRRRMFYNGRRGFSHGPRSNAHYQLSIVERM